MRLAEADLGIGQIWACTVYMKLNDMVAIPHVPKINGVIPSVDEETSDHQRLHDRLQLYGLVENKVQGDGNCQVDFYFISLIKRYVICTSIFLLNL
ncbi:OVARIAN TUMOR DOMAIN-containing deubiquitinating enzyme 9-like [Gossypium raimondii]|uniref:OVARIAN TUMOR DOMAIN-containing deubiquitinating enzyme 9-like n=1 Tax=Gossypium raimondii TaxID=29730 RepID=UPI00227BD5D1|nr:OVARIAN TUMOR DOMAIN-containing deubiquitinating enzyme 9-like [Gossypium raimondii]XP_052482624.1 OVARIAN TUMOR DOMAIN-containing deubiquitinating enzyme 9-like [Gossypium raimondii]